MPELPEVETVRTGLEQAIRGATIESVKLRRKDLRIPFPDMFAERVSGRTILSIQRRAKYLLFDLGELTMLAHLGMSGCFSVDKGAHKPGTHDHVLMMLGDGRRLVYTDPRRFGLITLVTRGKEAVHPLLAHLGPEPLGKEFTASYLARQLEKRNTPVKVAIMDQELVVGVGNIYASEALFLCGIAPKTPSKSVTSGTKALVSAIRKVLKDAIASGGSSLRDFVQVSGEAGYFQHHFNVYGREGKPCFACSTPIRSMRMQGRSTFFCPQCQK